MKNIINRVSFVLLISFSVILLVFNCGGSGTESGSDPSYDYYVDANTGSDGNSGTIDEPFKSITFAVANAETNATIKINPGTYNAANGEVFPINMQAGQQLTGDVANKGDGTSPTLVSGDGAVNSNTTTFIGAENTVITGLNIQDDAYNTGYYAVYIVNLTMKVTHNTFSSGYAGVRLDGTGDSTVSNNVFENSAYGVFIAASTGSLTIQDNTVNNNTSLPIQINIANSGTLITGNTIIGNGMLGIQISNGNPQIIGNTFNNASGYTYGAVSCNNITSKIRDNVFICGLAVLIRNAGSPIPDFGTDGDAGNNDFSAVSGYSIQVESGVSTTVYAIGNTFPNNPPTVDDIDNNGIGTVWWGTEGDDYF